MNASGKTKKVLAVALGAAFMATGAPVAKVDASELFATKEVSAYEIAGSMGKKSGEGSCGEGSCGGDKKGDHEGSCGEGRCGG